MSDVWQGPGWWLASDGKWYPEGGGPDVDGSVATTTDADAATESDTQGEPSESGARGDEDTTSTATTTAAAAAAAGPATGGWQAIEPDEPLGDDWTDPAIPVAEATELDSDPGWTNAYDDAALAEAEVTGVSPLAGDLADRVDEPTSVSGDAPPESFSTTQPTVERTVPIIDEGSAAAAGSVAGAGAAATIDGDIDSGAPDVAPPASKPSVGSGPIERDDAWRKPTDATMAGNGTATRTGAPEVVDLAVPEAQTAVEGEQPGVPWGSILKWLGIVLALVCLALLINIFFFDDDDGDVATDSPTTDTSSSAPSTTEEVDSTTSTNEDSTTTTIDETSTTESTIDPADGREVSVFDLRQGDCIESEIGAGQVQRLIAVDCDQPHEFEVYREALIDNSITEYDEQAISAQAEDICRTSLAAYIPADDERNLMFKWFQPTEESWNQPDDPDRVITCLLFDEDGPLIGRAA